MKSVQNSHLFFRCPQDLQSVVQKQNRDGDVPSQVWKQIHFWHLKNMNQCMNKHIFKKRRTSVDSFCWPRTGLWPNPFWTASTPKFPGSQCGMKMVIHNSASKSNKVVYRFIQLGYLCTHAAKTSVYVWSVQANAKRPGSVLPEIFPWFWEHQLHPASPPPSACGYLQVWRLHIAWYGCAKAFLVQSGQHINDGTKFQTILQWLRFIDSYAHLNIHNLHVDPIIQYVTLRNQNIKTTFKKNPTA